MARTNRTHDQAADQQLFDGITKNAQSLTFLVFQGKPVTPADVTAVLQKRIDSRKGVVTFRAVWQAAVKSDREERAQSGAFVSTIRQALKGAFADSPDILAEYGLKPRKPSVVSPQTRVAAAAKAKSTRAARHTMGTVQKSAILGNVTGVVVTPIMEKGAEAPAPGPTAPKPVS